MSSGRHVLLFLLLCSVVRPEPQYDGMVRPQADGSAAAYMKPPYKSNHAATIEVLPDGSLVGAWFSGAKEEAPGCAIVFATLPAGAKRWSAARTLSQRDKYSNQNPVLYFDNTTGILHLFHSQAPAEAGESESEIWHLQSRDYGANWTAPKAYFDSPGDFPRNRIIRRTDNRILFPFYSQAKGHPNWPVMAISPGPSIPPNGSAWQRDPLKSGGDLVQPTCMLLPDGDSTPKGVIECFFRDRRAKHIYSATSTDGGQAFSTPKPTMLPNNNAGIEANILDSGNLVMVFNPQTSGRDPLAIAVSSDDGKTWPHQRLIQHGDSTSNKGNEFSYPTVLQTNDGFIHVMYTYNRETIKYVRVTEDWITKPPSPPPSGSFTIVKGTDACATAGDFKMVATTDDLASCEDMCKKDKRCTIFDWNAHSGHCYHRYDGKWVLHPNDHVTSGCIAGVVKGCGTF